MEKMGGEGEAVWKTSDRQTVSPTDGGRPVRGEPDGAQWRWCRKASHAAVSALRRLVESLAPTREARERQTKGNQPVRPGPALLKTLPAPTRAP